jgi:hypothetical protein
VGVSFALHPEGVAWRLGHHPKDGSDLLVREAFVKEVGHAVDEDASWLAPPQRVLEMLTNEAYLASPPRTLFSKPHQAFIRLSWTAEAVCLPLRIATTFSS